MVYGGSPYALHLDLRVFLLELFLDGLLHVKLLLAYLLLIDQSVVGVRSDQPGEEILGFILGHKQMTAEAL